MKPIADERAALTSNVKNTTDVISVFKSWKKLCSIAGVGLLSFGATKTFFNTIATKTFALETATTAQTKQRKSGHQYSTLRRNNKGQEVEYLQYRLWEWGYFKQRITGFFGSDTENAGIVNARTWQALRLSCTAELF